MAVITGWFKVIRNGELIGTATNQSFARYSPKSGRVHICDAMRGEYVIVGGFYYHDDWMLPVNKDSYIDYEDASVVSIPEKEYDIIVTTGREEEVPEIEISQEKTDIQERKLTENDRATIEYVRSEKIRELSGECEKAIEDGFSLVLSDGADHHFTLTLKDQLNLISMQQALDKGKDAVYHADGELTQFYSAEDASDILVCADKWKQYHLALFNSLKNWINHLEDISEIGSITYETIIPEEYCTAAFMSIVENF